MLTVPRNDTATARELAVSRPWRIFLELRASVLTFSSCHNFLTLSRTYNVLHKQYSTRASMEKPWGFSDFLAVLSTYRGKVLFPGCKSEMPFSHHSHSGQFCNHASDKPEDVIQEAIRQRMQTLALTEHMPRNLEEDLYPGEVCVSRAISDIS